MLPVVQSWLRTTAHRRASSCAIHDIRRDSFLATGVRLCAVLAWGRNAEGQAGVEAVMLVPRPTPIMELYGASVKCLSAGKLHSSVVTADGTVSTWGNGSQGQLGLGSADSAAAPARIEALVGRVSMTATALGDTHSLFLDDQGQVWSCGENKSGQLGLGTPLATLASQRRRSWETALRRLVALQQHEQHQHHRRHRPHHAQQHGAGGRDTPSAFSQSLRAIMAPEVGPFGRGAAAAAAAGGGSSLGAFLQQAGGGGSAASAGGGGNSGGGGVAWAFMSGHGGDGVGAAATAEGARKALSFCGADVAGHLSAAGLREGVVTTPTRIGRDLHPLAREASAAMASSSAEQQHASGAQHRGQEPGQFGGRTIFQTDADDDDPSMFHEVGDGDISTGLSSETVVQVDTSRFFSVALTEGGELWTFGSGNLGSHNTLASSPQRVSGRLADVLSENGGVVRVAAGGTFCVALTSTGKAVVWGKVPGARGGKRDVGTLLGASIGLDAGEFVVAGVIPGLPELVHVASGHQHALLSDGKRVWAIGSWKDAAGNDCGSAHWSEPQEVLHLPVEGIASLACGTRCSAAVTGDGHVYMWGSLLDAKHAHNLTARTPAAHRAAPAAATSSLWAGFGADTPTLVHGLEGVKSIALGSWHALALVK